MSKVKVGVVGTGFIGPAHIEALRRLPNVEVLALCEVTKELAEAKAQQLGIERACTFDELLAMKDIQSVHICTPNFLHFKQAKAVLEAGKHVICEKPLATDVNEAKELVELAAQKGLVNAVHFNLRYYPLVRQIKTMREKGEIGEIYSILGSYLQDWLFYNTDYSWRLEPDKSGDTRAVADIGSHLIDMIEYTSGLKITEVFADFNIIHKIRKKPLKPVETYSGKMLTAEDYADVNINTEDHATILLRFDNGNKGSVTVSQVSAGRKNQLKLEISGSNCTIAFNSEAPNEMWIGRRDGANQLLMRDPALVHGEVRPLITYPGGHNEGFGDTSKQMFKEVYAAIEGGKQPDTPLFPTFADGYRELLIAESILESTKTEKWTKVL
ncbi:oxidoreductase domain protein [Leadbetterella byssophila DSM 17132]|uniref:Oxidoreductase domain protein n=1 Tax=Leadbetterella byssophila (strain DSM 17132 / JCM 16389 / KACC 11308 / NBRC 106382 / 4M15) TaxID=649349 RepID=E4RWV1_LEAB4|nr:Gfo/Idh/MocA family oxidoreductase [Leadbetterella byssophila]ADQ17157.1 oxidoreductase domain protein [Leadbetterella byssophila DSM 17132]